MKTLICFFLLALTAQMEAIIVETAHFQEIVSYIEKDTLVILDIDDTLLIPKQMLGCDEWFKHRCKEHCATGISSTDALEKTLAEWEAIRHISKMQIVEPGTERVVSSMQELGVTVMGLTTQGLALATRTVEQLKELQLNLTLTAPSPDDTCLAINRHCILYRKGILFTSGMPKGECLFALCEKIGYEPKRIVFINDKTSHLEDVQSSAETRGIEFIGLRYGFSDQRKEAFRSEIADYQFAHSTFQHLLSDEEAKSMMNQN